MNYSRVAVFGLVLISLIFDLLAFSTPGWIMYGSNGSCGLFGCATPFGYIQYTPVATFTRVAAGFLGSAMFFLLASSICAFLALKDQESANHSRTAGLIALVSAVFILVGMATYTGLFRKAVGTYLDIPWGYSFAFGWVAFILSLIGGIAAMYLK